MIDSLLKLLGGKNPGQDAQNCLARIISRYEMSRLSYREGITPERRDREEHNIAIGVWLFPQTENSCSGEFDVATGVPAVTRDFRIQGVGVMTPLRMKRQHFVLATPDECENWLFFQCEARHNTRKPGGWYQLGLHVDSVVCVDGEQLTEFKRHATAVCGELEAPPVQS